MSDPQRTRRPAYERARAAVLADPGRTMSADQIAVAAGCCKRVVDEAIGDLIAEGRIPTRSPKGRASQRPEVVSLINDGWRNGEIARALGLAYAYVSRIRSEERNRAQVQSIIKEQTPCS